MGSPDAGQSQSDKSGNRRPADGERGERQEKLTKDSTRLDSEILIMVWPNSIMKMTSGAVLTSFSESRRPFWKSSVAEEPRDVKLPNSLIREQKLENQSPPSGAAARLALADPIDAGIEVGPGWMTWLHLNHTSSPPWLD